MFAKPHVGNALCVIPTVHGTCKASTLTATGMALKVGWYNTSPQSSRKGTAGSKAQNTQQHDTQQPLLLKQPKSELAASYITRSLTLQHVQLRQPKPQINPDTHTVAPSANAATPPAKAGGRCHA